MAKGKKTLSAIICTLMAMQALALTSCSQEPARRPREVYGEYHRLATSFDYGQGSVGKLEGRTIVVSIFGSDDNYQWDFDNDDKASILNIRDSILMATDYIQGVAEDYGSKVWFEGDFISNTDLMYEVTLDDVVTTMDAEDSWGFEDETLMFIEDNIDEDALRDKYRADNVLYMMFLNTDTSPDMDAISCTIVWYPEELTDSEVTFLYNYDIGLLNPPSVYAHEMLHTFGAPDLYDTGYDYGYGITGGFLNYVETDLSNEIMYTCSDPVTNGYVYDRIPNEVSEVTAYFVGLIDHSDIVDEWGLTDPY